MKKIAEICPKGMATMTVYYDAKVKSNPYRVYKEWNECTPYGLSKKRKQIARYADLCSCAYQMYDYAAQCNEDHR